MPFLEDLYKQNKARFREEKTKAAETLAKVRNEQNALRQKADALQTAVNAAQTVFNKVSEALDNEDIIFEINREISRASFGVTDLDNYHQQEEVNFKNGIRANEFLRMCQHVILAGLGDEQQAAEVFKFFNGEGISLSGSSWMKLGATAGMQPPPGLVPHLPYSAREVRNIVRRQRGW